MFGMTSNEIRASAGVKAPAARVFNIIADSPQAEG
jgi:hypothetical protein